MEATNAFVLAGRQSSYTRIRELITVCLGPRKDAACFVERML